MRSAHVRARCSCAQASARRHWPRAQRRSTHTSARSSSPTRSLVQADLHERAGLMAFNGARPEAAGTHFEAGHRAFRPCGRDPRESSRRGATRTDHVGPGTARRRTGADGPLVPGAVAGGARCRSRRARSAARTVPLLRRTPRRRDGAHRVRARARRGPRAPGDVLAGAQYQGDSPRLARPDARRACTSSLCPRGRSRARQAVGSAPRVLQPRRHACAKRTATRRPKRRFATASPSHAASETGTRSSSSSARATRSSLSASGTRLLEMGCAAPGGLGGQSDRPTANCRVSICVTVLVHQGSLDRSRNACRPSRRRSPRQRDAQERAAHARGKSRLLLAHGDARRGASNRAGRHRYERGDGAQAGVRQGSARHGTRRGARAA